MNNQAINDPWVVQAPKVKRADIPPGAYMVTFLGWEDTSYTAPGKPPEDKWRWRFKVTTAGPHLGVELTSMTQRGINSGALAGRLIEGLVGQPLKPGDNVKALVDACVGKAYLAIWGKGPKGGVGVQSVSVPPAM